MLPAHTTRVTIRRRPFHLLGKPFQFMDYPNRTHAISEGEGTSLHLHTMLARFLLENLPPGPKPAVAPALRLP